jgi:hypothetical protein
MSKTYFFTSQDADNIAAILTHYLGDSWQRRPAYTGLLDDLLRYCTRLRNQPNTKAHKDGDLNVPEHQLITGGL